MVPVIVRQFTIVYQTLCTASICNPVQIKIDRSLHGIFAFSRGGSDSLRDATITPKVSVTRISTFAVYSSKTLGNRTSQHGANQSGITCGCFIKGKLMSPREGYFPCGDAVSMWPQVPSGFHTGHIRNIIKADRRTKDSLLRDAHGLGQGCKHGCDKANGGG